MTGAELRELRHGYAMGSARKLARRLHCHPSTIYRNEKRPRVTPFMAIHVEACNTARAFVSGMEAGRYDARYGR